MTLRKKVLGITALTIAGLFVVLASIARSVWLRSFDTLEAARVELNLRRVGAAIEDEIEKLESSARDWAEWDDTCVFVRDGNEAYRTSNLTPDTFERLGVDVMAYVQASGELTYVGAFDRVTRTPVTLPADIASELERADSPLLRGDGVRGIVAFSDRVAMVVSRPILSSKREGPAQGKLVLMRTFDDRAVSAFAHRTHVQVDAFRADGSAVPPELTAALAARAGGQAIQVACRDEDTIAGYTDLRDIEGRSAVYVRTLEPRNIHAEAHSGFRLFLGALVAIGVVSTALTLLLLERFVLVRLAQLSREARDVGLHGDVSHRVSVQGHDEFAATASAINGMLDQLARSRREHEASEAALRASEERLLQAEKMEAIGRLAGGLAHDFNNLLVVMIGHANLLATKLRGNPALVHHAVEIERAGERSAALTQRLLAFSRKQVIRPTVVDLQALIDQSEDMLSRLVGSDVQIVRKQSGPIDGVLIDPSQMTQVLLNVAANARDAMPHGGHLTLSTDVVDLDRESDRVPPGRWVRLTVEDDGSGMDESTLKHLFEPFFTTKAPGKGTGLGLASAHGIVHQAGGHIRVESTLGRGSVFRFYLPAVAPPVIPAPSKGPAPIAQPGSEAILLVDDEPAVRAVASAALASHGYRIIEADGPEEALELARNSSQPIRCLVTDVLMPRMRGPELARHLTAANPGLAVLFISGYPDDPDLLAAVAAGSSFLQKPFKPSALAQQVCQLLDGAQAPRP